ncbi:MAG: Ldh family oxidoreductase [Chloroflexota bacterium]
MIVRAEALDALGGAIFEAAGAPSDSASLVSRALVDANLAGHDSHGVIRIPEYLSMIKDGRLKPAARPTMAVDQPSAVLVDGGWGFGQVTATFAVDEAVARARTHAVAAVGLIRANHLGRLGAYMEAGAAAGCVTLAWVGGLRGPQQAVPFGGAKPAYGTNPFAAGFPLAGEDPMLVDFATTAVAGGKVMVARAAGQAVPPGCIVDSAGRPTTNPDDFFNGGALLPFGAHKGFGLAVLAELLGQVLTGADETGREVGEQDAFARAGALFVAIDAGIFRSTEQTAENARRSIQRIREIPPAPGFDRVRTPGEPEADAHRTRSAQGIDLPPATWEELQSAARSVGVAI